MAVAADSAWGAGPRSPPWQRHATATARRRSVRTARAATAGDPGRSVAEGRDGRGSGRPSCDRRGSGCPRCGVTDRPIPGPTRPPDGAGAGADAAAKERGAGSAPIGHAADAVGAAYSPRPAPGPLPGVRGSPPPCPPPSSPPPARAASSTTASTARRRADRRTMTRTLSPNPARFTISPFARMSWTFARFRANGDHPRNVVRANFRANADASRAGRRPLTERPAVGQATEDPEIASGGRVLP